MYYIQLLTILGALAVCESIDVIGLPGSGSRCQANFECLAFTTCIIGHVPVCQENQCTCSPSFIGRSVEKVTEPRAMCTSNFQCLIMTCFVGTPQCSGGVCGCSAGKRELVKESRAMCTSNFQCLIMTCFVGNPQCSGGVCRCSAGKRELVKEKRAVCQSDTQCSMFTDCFVGRPVCTNTGCSCSPLTSIDRPIKVTESRAMCTSNFQCLIMTCFVGTPQCSGGVCGCSAGELELVKEKRAVCQSDTQCSMFTDCFVGRAVCTSTGCSCSSLTSIDRPIKEERGLKACTSDVQCSVWLVWACIDARPQCLDSVCRCSNP